VPAFPQAESNNAIKINSAAMRRLGCHSFI
jgi:hypothetical protein